MKKTLFKNKHMMDIKIELFCQSIKEILTKIKDRCGTKEKKKRKDEDVMTLEEELMTVLQ